MSPTPNEDPLPAFMFASWLAFLIPAAYACVHGPDVLADGFALAASFFGGPLPGDATAVVLVRQVSGGLIAVASAVLFSGYLLYGFAPPAAGSRVGTYVGAFAASTLCGLIFPFSAWVWAGPWQTRMGAAIFTWLGWLLYLRRAANVDQALDRPFVLFFRRFDSFGDLSVLPSLMRLTPNGVPVVMLVGGMENEVGHWDPMKLVNYGLRSTVPWGGRPVFLRGGDDWERVMESLVDRAAVVVLDQTETSEAMTKEAETVRQRGRPLILLTEAGQAGAEPVRGDAFDIEDGRGRGALALRAALFAVIVATVLYLVELPRQVREKAAEGELWSGLFGAALMLGFVSTIFGGLLLRRGLTRDARLALADGLRERLASTPISSPRH